MVRFFSKLRLKYAAENKLRKYLRYAIGEVFLVVVGILIALQVNNWNERKKNQRIEYVLYDRIIDDLDLDKALLLELIDQMNEKIQTARQIILELDLQSKNRNYLLNQFLFTQRTHNFIPRDVTFRDLTSTGKLYLISDLEIKTSLIQYYSDLENKLLQLEAQKRELSRQVYSVDSYSGFGVYEFDYISEALGPEVVQLLTTEDWTKDKISKNYTKFQDLLLVVVAQNLRIVSHYETILEMMEVPYELLIDKSKD